MKFIGWLIIVALLIANLVLVLELHQRVQTVEAKVDSIPVVSSDQSFWSITKEGYARWLNPK